MIKDIDLLEQIMARHADCLGSDLHGYRNHVYRVVNLCCLQAPLTPAQQEQVVIAAAFHDLGIWTARTFDYLAPSRQLATAFLAEHGQPAWAHDVLPMIDDHHRISATGAPDQLPEIFRRADWIDVSLGLITFGLDRAQVRAVRRAFPNAGFHRRLVALSAKRLLTHPLDPLPMLKR